MTCSGETCGGSLAVWLLRALTGGVTAFPSMGTLWTSAQGAKHGAQGTLTRKRLAWGPGWLPLS